MKKPSPFSTTGSTTGSTIGAAPGAISAPADALRNTSWLRLALVVSALVLAGLALWTRFALQREHEQRLSDQLRLVVRAETEVVRAALRNDTKGDARPELVHALRNVSTLLRVGGTGEAYAFDRQGVMLTRSRFEHDVNASTWMSEVDGEPRVLLRDPGGPLPAGHSTTLPRQRQPLTKMAQAALSGRPGLDLDGYRDYRGVEVVGAWTWLPEYELGLAFEIDVSEARAWTPGARLLLLALYLSVLFSALAAFAGTRLLARASTERAAAEQLGQYTLVREIGRGGMGTVYEARHAHLRRATAVKLMNATVNDPGIAAEALLRFEREVQLTSQLSHPNTIVIYDYGRTAQGTFYYAMEYIDGVDLERLVRIDGPLAVGRIVHFALQVCGSLNEAHEKSLIHRDIKPANLLVCERGSIPDTIKVLDFGLVKSLMGPQVSAAHVLVGTPQFVAPEVIRDPGRADARSDIYSLGAVMYWLATGHMPFDDVSTMESLAARARVRLPSSLRPDLPVDLERSILRCLAYEPLDRPLSMSELAAELRGCRAYGKWSPQDARRYWRDRGARFSPERHAPHDVQTLAAT